jgi:hypothetical protein
MSQIIIEAGRTEKHYWADLWRYRDSVELAFDELERDPNWELALGLQAREAGKGMIFDPTVTIIHNVAPRHDGDTVHRGIFNYEGTSDIHALVLGRAMTGLQAFN